MISIKDWQDPYGELLRTDLLVEDGLYAQANDTYDSITARYPMSGDEYDEFVYSGRRLMDLRIALSQDTLSSVDLNGSQVTELENIADSAHMWAKVRAQNWLNLYDGRLFTPDMLFPQDASLESNSQNTERRVNQSIIEGYKVVPNPIENFIDLQFKKQTEGQQTFIITDVTGRKVFTGKLKGLSGSVQFDVHQLQPGIYFYKITEGGTTITSGKLLKK